MNQPRYREYPIPALLTPFVKLIWSLESVTRFVRALHRLRECRQETLTYVAVASGYYDQALGWRTLNLGKHLTFAVPPDAVAVEVRPIDSIFGVLRGDGYEIIYDCGLSGEDFAALKDQPGYTQHNRRFEGRMATEVSFRSEDKAGEMVRILQIKDGANLLTIRVSCARDDTGPLAQAVFDSVKFTSGSRR
jgi:hypothetical protein